MKSRTWAFLLAVVVLVGACATGPSTPAATSPSAGAGTAVAGTAVAAQLAPTGATAPIDPAAWALAGRLTAANYTSDTTSAMVAALARAGIATYSDPSSLGPETPLTGAASPLALLDFEVHGLAVGVWTGASWSGAELDSLMPIPAGSTDAAPASVLLASYVAAVDSPGAALARAVGNDLKSELSMLAYAVSIALAFVRPWIAITLYVAVALMWLVPDRRIESVLKK